MLLPKAFEFSATSLQDYVDCPRRFQLRYALQVAWPAPEAEPISEREHHSRLARDFHQLVHQHLLGLPTENLSASVHDPDLERWWKAYLAYVPNFGNVRVMPEVGLSTPLAGYRLMAQYDAVVVSDQQAMLIVDWKTYRQRPSQDWLAQRLQTRVYPVVLIQAGASIANKPLSRDFDHPIQPDAVEMRYWLAEYPEDPESFRYDEAIYQADLGYLTDLITEINERLGDVEHVIRSSKGAASDEIWPLTADVRRCRYCNYRSLCERGDVAGPLKEYIDDGYSDSFGAGESELDVDLDWGQVQEIVY